MHARTTRTGHLGLLTAVVVGVGLLGVPAPVGAVSPTPPVIRAMPDNVMVNTQTTLVGTGFPGHASVTVVECPVRSWVVMSDPCDTTNKVTVTTNGRGRFRSQMTVHTCPGGARTGPGGLAFLCYLGVVRPSGIDTDALQPWTSIVVTYP